MLSIDRTLLRSNLSRTVTTEWGPPVSSAWLDNYAIRVIIYATCEIWLSRPKHWRTSSGCSEI